MKLVGILLVIVGVALAASYGARVSAVVEEQLTVEGTAKFRGGLERTTFAAYCAAREEAGLEPADGCGEEPGEAAVPGADLGYEELVARNRARVQELLTTEEALGESLLDQRAEWLAAAEANVEPSARAAVAEIPGPGLRLERWASQSGAMFGLGMLLIVIGAVIGRVAVKREMSAEPTGTAANKAAAQDFGKLLEGLAGTIRALADEAHAAESPAPADYKRLQDHIHAAQLESFEPLIEARGRVQVKYGLAGFADLFGPLSSAERKLNRAWSAVVDRHWPETTASLDGAATDLEEAHRVLSRLVAKT